MYKMSLTMLVLSTLISGCQTTANQIAKEDIEYGATAAPAKPLKPMEAGSIFSEDSSLLLVGDNRAKNVGDIITIILDERTNATKEASSQQQSTSSMNLTNPIAFGNPVSMSKIGIPELSLSTNDSQNFQGAANTVQSNTLSGQVTVTVAQVLNNGYLAIQGRKKIKMTEGSETILVKGIVRPSDISPDNTVNSSLVADMDITYKTDGSAAGSVTPGWLWSFINKVYPL